MPEIHWQRIDTKPQGIAAYVKPDIELLVFHLHGLRESCWVINRLIDGEWLKLQDGWGANSEHAQKAAEVAYRALK